MRYSQTAVERAMKNKISAQQAARRFHFGSKEYKAQHIRELEKIYYENIWKD